MIKLETHRGATPFRRRFFFLKKKQGPGARDLYGAPTRIDFRQRGPTAYRLVLRVIRLAVLGWTRTLRYSPFVASWSTVSFCHEEERHEQLGSSRSLEAWRPIKVPSRSLHLCPQTHQTFCSGLYFFWTAHREMAGVDTLTNRGVPPGT